MLYQDFSGHMESHFLTISVIEAHSLSKQKE